MFFGNKDNKETPAAETDEAPKVFELESNVDDEEGQNKERSADEYWKKEKVEENEDGDDSSGKKDFYAPIDIASIVCLFVMSIFFICGSSFVDDGDSGLDEPLAFFLVGALVYMAVASLDIVKRKSKGVLEIVGGSIGLLGGLFWFIGSIFLFRSTLDLKAWGGLWICGSLCNLYVITYDLVMLLRSQTKSLFRAIALALAWLANLFFVGGAGHLIALSDRYYVVNCDVKNAAGVLVSGSVMYCIHSIFQILALCMDNVIFSIKVSRSAPVPTS